MSLIEFRQQGIYCPRGDFYVDPWRPVKNAIITHAHSDHARFGMSHYYTHHLSVPIIKYRLGVTAVYGYGYNEPFTVNGVKISFHPAGHIPGSAQVRVEYKGEVWVMSGDYKLVDDGVATPFEPVKCHAFITESTFGLPIYKWQNQAEIFNEVNLWWAQNAELGKTSVLLGYSLGKAQRLLQNVDESIGKIYTHGAVDNVNKLYAGAGLALRRTERVTYEHKKGAFKGALIIAPTSAINSPWLKRFEPYSIGIASGWMALRGARRRKSADRGFAISDHADWNELDVAIKATGAERVYVTHGYTAAYSRWLNENGIYSEEVKTEFEGEGAEMTETESSEDIDNS